jgi:hypothetical protein
MVSFFWSLKSEHKQPIEFNTQAAKKELETQVAMQKAP